MQKEGIVVPVSIDAGIFRNFALFDSFYRQKRWRPLAVFAAILLASAIICFTLAPRSEQAVFLGSLLTLIGLGLPVVYYASYLSSIGQQCKKLRLTVPRHAYTITLGTEEGILADTGRERLPYRWEDVHGVYRAGKCTYLYVAPQKAYLLPDHQVPGGADALWELLKGSVPAGRLHGRRG